MAMEDLKLIPLQVCKVAISVVHPRAVMLNTAPPTALTFHQHSTPLLPNVDILTFSRAR